MIELVCPNCKESLRLDTVLGDVVKVNPDEYPPLQPHGTAWCVKCQHGAIPTEDGFCSDCKKKGIEFRIQPPPKTKSNKPETETVVEDGGTTSSVTVKMPIKPSKKVSTKKPVKGSNEKSIVKDDKKGF